MELDNSGDTAETILLAEDDDATRLLLRTALAGDGYQFLEAKDGIEAVALFERHRPNLVLVDLAMPGLNGLEACARIKASSENTPIVVITAINDERLVKSAFAAGVTDYLTKPLHWAVARYRIRRILDSAHTERRLRLLAYHDTVTGLPNRPLFYDRVWMALARADRSGHLLALMVLGIDGFHPINERHGRKTGEELLRRVADRLTAAVRKNDTVARFGGDQFTVLLEDLSSPGDVYPVVDKLLAMVKEPIEIDGVELRVTASIGIAYRPTDGHDMERLIHVAETHMEHVRMNGGDGYRTTD